MNFSIYFSTSVFQEVTLNKFYCGLTLVGKLSVRADRRVVGEGGKDEILSGELGGVVHEVPLIGSRSPVQD